MKQNTTSGIRPSKINFKKCNNNRKKKACENKSYIPNQKMQELQTYLQMADLVRGYW